MEYTNIVQGTFLERPNRFIAYVEIEGKKETVHVKNTGRCAELLREGVTVYLQKSDHSARKTKWDLIGVEKEKRMVNMDSQIPNAVVREWLEKTRYFGREQRIYSEKTYGQSRLDLYVESGERKVCIEVNGVTLEEDDVACFPDAPSERAVKHLNELMKAKKEGYDAYVFFVIQMKGIRYFTPNARTHPEFAETLRKAKEAGVNILACDCQVTSNSIEIADPVPVVVEQPLLMELAKPLVNWYREHKRQLPWRENPDAYRVWVSEIMLQQTRVEAVKPYYEHFLERFPTVRELAEAPEDVLLKYWEGLGYYNRVRNMQLAAQQIMTEYEGEFPEDYEKIKSLKGIGNYTAGAISSFAFGIPKPAVDGNVLRVISRILASQEDIMKASVRKEMEKALEEVIPEAEASDFNQGLIELGAIVCVPNGEPKCEECPVAGLCRARKEGIQMKLPVKKKAKERRIEKKTIVVFRDPNHVVLHKRPGKGLLAGMYELPNVEGHLTRKQVIEYAKEIGLVPVRVKKLPEAKHIFSHVEWQMIGYEVLIDELERKPKKDLIFADKKDVELTYSIPSAFSTYMQFS